MSREEEIKKEITRLNNEITKLNNELVALRKEKHNIKIDGKYKFILFKPNARMYGKNREHYRTKYDVNDSYIESYIYWGFSIDFFDNKGNFIYRFENKIDILSIYDTNEIRKLAKIELKKTMKTVIELVKE